MHEHLIIGLQGLALSAEERRWLRERPPKGVILFARNIESPEQVTALLAEVRSCTGEETWTAIDEEGGRVNRIPWAPFNQRKSAAEYGELFQSDPGAATKAAYADAHATGLALKKLGFTHNCAPVLDVFHAAGHAIIGERAYSFDPQTVAELGAACMQGLQASGIEAVGKHFPGHGRANADSHVNVPEVDAELEIVLTEAEPFHTLIRQGLHHVMTAHVIYSDVENQVATLSSFWLKEVLKKRFGFTGNIWSDDLCMKGVGENVSEAAKSALGAGCDILLVCEPAGVRSMYET
ncbi:MAG: beta-N-acetylhexosaminidase [Mariprofundaceae bacterium]